jgi:hypothetical protein
MGGSPPRVVFNGQADEKHDSHACYPCVGGLKDERVELLLKVFHV